MDRRLAESFVTPAARALKWLVQISLVLNALYDQLLGFVQQGTRFRHRIDGFPHHRIRLDGHSLRVFIAEARSVHFALELLLNPSMVFVPFGVGESSLFLG